MPTTYAKMEQENSSLRADIAAKDAEGASLKAEIPARMLRFPQRRLGYRILSLEHELAAEKAAHEKSEARVRELESELSRAVEEIEALIKGGNMGLMNLLANRKKEESK